MVMKKKEENWKQSTITAQLKSEEVELCVPDREGWDIFFDIKPVVS